MTAKMETGICISQLSPPQPTCRRICFRAVSGMPMRRPPVEKGLEESVMTTAGIRVSLTDLARLPVKVPTGGPSRNREFVASVHIATAISDHLGSRGLYPGTAQGELGLKLMLDASGLTLELSARTDRLLADAINMVIDVVDVWSDSHGRRLISDGGRGRVRVWETRTGDCVAEVDALGPHFVAGTTGILEVGTAKLGSTGEFAFLSAYQHIVVGNYDWTGDETIELMLSLGNRQEQWSRTSAGLSNPCYLNQTSDTVLCRAANRRGLDVLDLRTGEVREALLRPGSVITAADLSADGRHALIGCESGQVALWSTEGRGRLTVLPKHYGPVTTARFAGPVPVACTAGADGVLRMFDLRSRKVVFRAEGVPGKITRIIFDPEQGRITTLADSIESNEGAAGHRMLTVWDQGTGERELRLTFPNSEAAGLQFDRFGRRALFRSKSGLHRTLSLSYWSGALRPAWPSRRSNAARCPSPWPDQRRSDEHRRRARDSI